MKKRLTWRSFSHMFIINEDNIHTKKSILLPKTEVSVTYFLSALWFLLTGNDYSELNEQEERRIRKAKNEEIIKRINSDISKYADKKAELEDKLNLVGDSDVIAMAQTMIAELNAVKMQISNANERGRYLLGEIMTARQTITDCDMHIGRFVSLRSNFQTDVKRLSMIADGKAELDEVAPFLEECPIGGGHVLDVDDDIIAAANEDLKRIISDMGDLNETIIEQKALRATTELELARLEKEKSDIEHLVEERLAPRETILHETLKNYHLVAQLRAEIDLISEFTSDCERDLVKYERGNESVVEYRVKEHYKNDDNFRSKINDYVYEAFEECRYERLSSTFFSIDKFEVFINGQEKGTSHGQGHRAFINTVLALAFRKYLHDNALYKTGLFVVDSPLQSLKQGVSDFAEDSMKAGLFRYLLNHQNEGQVIVIENDIPDLEYEKYGVKPIEFAGGKKAGRYGFLFLDGQY